MVAVIASTSAPLTGDLDVVGFPRFTVGKKSRRVQVDSGRTRVFQIKGATRSRVVKVGPQPLGRVRVPAQCHLPEVLLETWLKTAENAGLASTAGRWN